MSEKNFPTDNEFSLERLEAANEIFQLNELQSEREKDAYFSSIRSNARVTRTISQIRCAQKQIASQRAAIARAIARDKVAKCRNTQARTLEWLLKK